MHEQLGQSAARRDGGISDDVAQLARSAHMLRSCVGAACWLQCDDDIQYTARQDMDKQSNGKRDHASDRPD